MKNIIRISAVEQQEYNLEQLLPMPFSRERLDRLEQMTLKKNKLLKKTLKLRRDPIELRRSGSNVLIRFYGIAGVLTLEQMEFEIAPKFSARASDSWRSGFFNMLCVSEYNHISFEHAANMGHGSISFYDHAAVAFLQALKPALPKGLICTYQSVVTETRFIRGRLMIEEQIKKVLTAPGTLVLEHDVYNVDNAFNYLLFWTTKWLIANVRSHSIRNRLRALQRMIPQFSKQYLIPVYTKLPPQYKNYQDAIQIGNIIAKGASMILQDKGMEGYGFLFNTEKTYEKFLEKTLKHIALRHKEWTVQAQSSALLAYPAEHTNRKIHTRPDNKLFIRELPAALIDAKYKCDLSNHEKLSRPESADYYQMLASLIAHGCSRALLVVPSDEEMGEDLPPLCWKSVYGASEFHIGLLQWNLSDISTALQIKQAEVQLENAILQFLAQ